MSLKSFLRKAGTALGGLLLASNIGCRSGLEIASSVSPRQNRDLEAEVELEAEPRASLSQASQGLSCEDFVREKKRLKAWQYPINLVGGWYTNRFLIEIAGHEGGHALAGTLVGAKVKSFELFPEYEGKTYVACTNFEPETLPEPDSSAFTFILLAGPIAQRACIEAINYNLRSGKIDKKNQAFWATTSLIARYELLQYAVREGYNPVSDFHRASENMKIAPETFVYLIFLDGILNGKKISKEAEVALGLGHYPVRSERKQSLDLVPTGNGLSLRYSKRF